MYCTRRSARTGTVGQKGHKDQHFHVGQQGHVSQQGRAGQQGQPNNDMEIFQSFTDVTW